jgi:hypothetical protein
MAFTENLSNRTSIAGSAIVQFTFVSLAADGQVDNSAASVRTDGVALQAATAAGQAITVAYDGRVTVLVGSAGGIARGDAVAVDAAGKAKKAASTNIIVGYALEAGAAAQIITVELSRAEAAAA